MTWALILGLAGVALYLGLCLRSARADNAELAVRNARLKRRLAQGTR
jgi:hypothetical protein